MMTGDGQGGERDSWPEPHALEAVSGRQPRGNKLALSVVPLPLPLVPPQQRAIKQRNAAICSCVAFTLARWKRPVNAALK